MSIALLGVGMSTAPDFPLLLYILLFAIILGDSPIILRDSPIILRDLYTPLNPISQLRNSCVCGIIDVNGISIAIVVDV